MFFYHGFAYMILLWKNISAPLTPLGIGKGAIQPMPRSPASPASGSSFLLHFVGCSSSSLIDATAIMSFVISLPRGNLTRSLYLWVGLTCWGNGLFIGWGASVLLLIQIRLTWRSPLGAVKSRYWIAFPPLWVLLLWSP